MLASLHIENLAVIKSVDIDFCNGFLALTGETGAGKSVIIDSINLLLGAKAERELIRTGESTAHVSGVFSDLSDKTLDSLKELGIFAEEDRSISVQRIVSQDGKSNVKINGRGATLSVLRAIAPTLVSVHGQSDTASLTDSKNQLDILDVYAENGELISEYSALYSKISATRQKIRDITEKENERERLIEILKYQIADIDSYGLHDGEEEELVDRKLKIKNSEKILKNAGFVFKALKGSEKGSVSFLLDRSATALQQLSDVIPRFQEFSERLRDFLYQTDDIAEEVYAEIADMDEDPTESLNEIESRLDKISKLKRKYGYTVKDILEFRDKAKEELNTLTDSEGILKELADEESRLYRDSVAVGKRLREKRIAAAREIEKEVKSTLEFLDMPKVVFFTDIKGERDGERDMLYSDGLDTVEFFISANRGAEAQPLSKVASGGELARVMLALKSVIADKDGVSTVIFDEIDAGVSGKTARKIGIKMLELSKGIQIFAVTHSAQIASLADAHYLISKTDVNGATETLVGTLDKDGRIKELSRILGGIAVTSAQRAAAIDMLNEKYDYTEK